MKGERWTGLDADAVADEAARRFVDAARTAVAARGRFVVALAGGSTPKATYERLASPSWRGEVDWPRVQVCFGDERAVPPDHRDSNYGMARRALLDHVPVAAAHVHRIEGERPDADARYEHALHALLPDGVFDLVLLGMGPDGHTASLFPHTPALHERHRRVVKNHVAKLQADRFTITFPTINAARAVVLTVCGAEKAPALLAIGLHPDEMELYPVLGVAPRAGALTWLLDRSAAG